jgi:hypothetical protein
MAHRVSNMPESQRRRFELTAPMTLMVNRKTTAINQFAA